MHKTNLYGTIVGGTAKVRKGTSWNRVKKPLTLADPDWGKQITGGLSSGEGLLVRMGDPEEDGNSITVDGEEVRGERGGATDKRLMIVESEFSSVLRAMNRANSRLGHTVTKMWEDGTADNLTKNATKVTDGHLSIIGHVTEHDLREDFKTTDMANGFGNRFLWIAIEGKSKHLPHGGVVPQGELNALVSRLQDAFAFAREIAPEEYEWSVEAKERWEDVYDDLERPVPGLLGAMTARGTPIVRRLAVIYAVLDESLTVDVDHLLAAKALWDYGDESAAYLFGSKIGDQIADKIYAALLEHVTGLSREDISTLLGRNKSKSEVDAAISLLTHTSLAVETDGPRGKKGRPAKRLLATRTLTVKGISLFSS